MLFYKAIKHDHRCLRKSSCQEKARTWPATRLSSICKTADKQILHGFTFKSAIWFMYKVHSIKHKTNRKTKHTNGFEEIQKLIMPWRRRVKCSWMRINSLSIPGNLETFLAHYISANHNKYLIRFPELNLELFSTIYCKIRHLPLCLLFFIWALNKLIVDFVDSFLP